MSGTLYPKLRPEVKTAWVAALRSGTFTQGRGWLRDSTDKYCCLGVRCELAVQAGVIRNQGLNIHGYAYGPESEPPEGIHRVNDTMPPQAEREWAWADYDGEWDDIQVMEAELAGMNDDGVSFREIADKIEERF